MATYAIGDVQGCFDQLMQLLAKIQFNIKEDYLWFTGDLVNRGPNSLEVLRFVKSLAKRQHTVLGNHDLHLLSVALGVTQAQPNDTFDEILMAADRHELIDWLRTCPLLHHDESNYVMTHAGLAPSWGLPQAKVLAQEVEQALRGDAPEFFLANIYGNQPDCWDERLQGVERLRCITNYLTRMRFCYADGRLNLTHKGEVSHSPRELLPWFQVKTRVNTHLKIIFGHWAALGGQADVPNVYPLDTGCVWGHCLTAMRLEDEKHFSVSCKRG
ncbi:MAG: bis(5'-nucleosyl)-tetraphosphatase (symmetrical) [Gammaproteobacteria bacterium RIFCSPHIGHO2_12_FULL_37_14]|nr:MAG: bis(5'-nucleosyl)-tetraphosphatase (symmetrical) [Gammaproteobacteria bacterium RIFCSPHIGHO2_12_FULL_37_14]